MRFLGLSLAASVPDAKTMWVFREELKEHKLTEKLFDRFDECLRALNVELKSGQIVDATFVTVRSSEQAGRECTHQGSAIPIEWGKEPHKLAQKDTDARWTKKNGESIYGYKDHVNVDRDTKLITAWEDTPAQSAWQQALEAVLRSRKKGGGNSMQTAPTEARNRKPDWLRLGHVSQINEKGSRATPLSDEQKTVNRTKSKFVHEWSMSLGRWPTRWGHLHRTIGRARAQVQIGLLNLTYNLKRVAFLISPKALELRQGYCACCKLKWGERHKNNVENWDKPRNNRLVAWKFIVRNMTRSIHQNVGFLEVPSIWRPYFPEKSSE